MRLSRKSDVELLMKEDLLRGLKVLIYSRGNIQLLFIKNTLVFTNYRRKG